jgi:hypothetical protein
LFYETLDNRIMVRDYTVEGASFIPGKARLWTERRLFYPGALNLWPLTEIALPSSRHPTPYRAKASPPASQYC